MRVRQLLIVAMVLIFIPACKPSLNKVGGLMVCLEIPDSDYSQAMIDSAFLVLKNRVRYCAPSATVEFSPDRREILMEIPGIYDSALVPDFILKKGNLFLFETYENEEILPCLANANDYLKSVDFFGYKPVTNYPPDPYSFNDSSMVDTQSLFFILRPAITFENKPERGAIIGYSTADDTSLVNRLLSPPDVRSLFPRQLKLSWGYKTGEVYPLVALKINHFAIHMTREVVEDCTLGKDGLMIDFNFRESYHDTLRKLTSENLNKSLAQALDDRVLFAANVMNTIEGGNMQCSSNLSYEEAPAVVAICLYGPLDVRFTVRENRIVEPGSRGNGPIRPDQSNLENL